LGLSGCRFREGMCHRRPTMTALQSGAAFLSEDTAVIRKARIAAEGAEQWRLEAELQRLKQEAKANEARTQCSSTGAAVFATLPAGCSVPLASGGGLDEKERLVLLAAFQHTAPVAASVTWGASSLEATGSKLPPSSPPPF